MWSSKLFSIQYSSFFKTPINFKSTLQNSFSHDLIFIQNIFIIVENYLITFTKDRLPFYSWKINTLITRYNHGACHTFTRSSVWQKEKRQVNKSDFSRSARPTGLLSLSWKRMQDDTRNRLVSRQNSYPPERCERFCEHSSSSLSTRRIIRSIDIDSIRISNNCTISISTRLRSKLGEGMAGIKCMEKKRFRV